MSEQTLQIDGIQIPRFLYGTAWKEDDTRRLTALAIEQGFRGIDTANQRRHYHEAGVGEAVREAISRGRVARSDLFLQTKFTFQRGQDQRLPYDPAAPIPIQVAQSFASSMVHLGSDYLDSFVLHGPNTRTGLTADDWAAWKAMETLHDGGQVRCLGVSNVSLDQLRDLCRAARVKPRFVQNRCYGVRAWDREIRHFCSEQGLIYQGFSLLTANPDVLTHRALLRIAQRYGRTASQIVFRFALDVGMLPLTGTTGARHMQEDLDVVNFHLEPQEIETIERLVTG